MNADSKAARLRACKHSKPTDSDFLRNAGKPVVSYRCAWCRKSVTLRVPQAVQS